MHFIRRFSLYFVGILLGTFVTFIFFGNRDISCSYFPNSRVLKNINAKHIVYKQNVKNSLVDLNIDIPYIRTMLKEGDINFNESNTMLDSCKIYQIEYKKYAIKVRNCDSVSFVYEIWKK